MRLAFVSVLGLAAALGCGASDAAGERVWTSSSASLRLELSLWPRGTTAWEKKRDELTPSQLATLDGLVSSAPVHSSTNDAQEVLVRVTDADRTTRDYRVAIGNDFARGGLNEDLPTIDYASIRGLLDGVHCLLSSETVDQATKAGRDPVTNAPNPAWRAAPDVLGADPGCLHPIAKQPSGAATWVRLQLPVPGDYSVTLEPCVTDGATMHLRTSDGASELAASSPAVAPACVKLDFHAAGGSLLLGIEGGSFVLRVRPH